MYLFIYFECCYALCGISELHKQEGKKRKKENSLTKNVYQNVDSPGKFSQSKQSLIKVVKLASIQHPSVPDYIFLSH